jgi:hypothetical protein
MHKYSGTMGFQRLIKAVKNTGKPGPDSVGTSQIINGTIKTADISNGAITQEKFSSELQLALVTFTQQLTNLENPGFWGNLRIINDNSSDSGATMNITVQSEYYDAPTNNTVITQRLGPTTITKNHHVDIPITIDDRLTNTETILRMYYSINKDSIEVVSNDIVEEDDKGGNEIGNYYVLSFRGLYADMNDGDAVIGFSITN